MTVKLPTLRELGWPNTSGRRWSRAAVPVPVCRNKCGQRVSKAGGRCKACANQETAKRKKDKQP